MRHREILTCAGQQFVRSHFTEWGAADNPNVICCVHGLTRNCRDFDELARALSCHFRVVCVDIVGRGLSGRLDDPLQYNYVTYIQQLAGVLAHLNVERLKWVGTSMGGILGILLAAMPHTPIGQLVLSDVGPVIPKQALEAIARYLGKAPLFRSLAEVENYLRQIHSGFGSLSDHQWRHLAVHGSQERDGEWVLSYDPAIAAAFGPVSEDIDLSPVWHRVRCPVLVLRGAESTLLRRDLASQMALKPQVTVREFANVGHAPMMMSADQIEAVRGFVEQADWTF